LTEPIEIIVSEESQDQKPFTPGDNARAQGSDEYLDQLQRLQAEFENYRKRSNRERLQLTDDVRGDVCKHLLPILDDLERALTHSTSDPGSLRTGVELVYRNLKTVLENMGLSAIEAVEQPFDPQIHEAVMVAVEPELRNETVSEEFQKGYRFKEKLLRPAKVKVSKGNDG
jgi:molecular chaperone GrpE